MPESNDLDAGLSVETVTNKDDPSKTNAQKNTAVPAADYPHLQGYFGLDHATTADRAQLQAVWDYFAAESDNEADILYKLRQMENRLAQPPLGVSRLSHLNDYIHVLSNVRLAERAQDQYLRS